MTSSHLSESDIQAAAEAAGSLPAAQLVHLRTCLLCQGRVATYRQVYAAAAHQPPPAFAFDLAAAVVARLPRQQPASFPGWVLWLVASLVVGVVGMAWMLFGSLLGPAFQGAFTQLGAGLAVVAGAIVAGQCLEMLLRYRRQLSLLAMS